jgi:hypothetical protein
MVCEIRNGGFHGHGQQYYIRSKALVITIAGDACQEAAAIVFEFSHF